MGLFDSKAKRDWEGFLRTASEEDLSKERWRQRQIKNKARDAMREIQAEVDRRTQENPPERGQVIHI